MRSRSSRELAVAVLLAWPAAAQVDASFSPQPGAVTQSAYGRLPGLTAYQVLVCNRGTAAATVQGAQVYRTAQTRLATVTRSYVMSTVLAGEKRHPLRIVMLGITYGGAAASVAANTEALSANKTWRAALPVGTVAANLASAALKKEIPQGRLEQLDREMLPPVLQLAPGACMEHLIFAGTRSDENPFAAEVR